MLGVPPPPVMACWQKSSASGDPDSECLEVSRAHEQVWVRDSKNRCGPVLGCTREGWVVFILGVQRGEFDRAGVPA